MTINFGPYVKGIEPYANNGVQPVSRVSPVARVLNNTEASQTDVYLVEDVDPVFEGEPGYLLDVYA
ncbi:MAG: hypothetical protein ACOYJB_02055 [Christensenellaceae bacterium]